MIGKRLRDETLKWKEIENHGFIFSLEKQKSYGLFARIAEDSVRLLSSFWPAQQTVA